LFRWQLREHEFALKPGGGGWGEGGGDLAAIYEGGEIGKGGREGKGAHAVFSNKTQISEGRRRGGKKKRKKKKKKKETHNKTRDGKSHARFLDCFTIDEAYLGKEGGNVAASFFRRGEWGGVN